MSYKVSPLKLPLQAHPPKVSIPDILDSRQQYLLGNGWPRHAFDRPVEIIPRLWLSGIAFDPDIPSWCQKNGFTHIINAAGGDARAGFYKTQPQDHGINYLELDLLDIPQFGIGPFISKLYAFISEAYSKGGKILIHCVWGQSRSVACLIYFLMINRDINYDTALSIIRKSRPAAAPNTGFELQLRLIDLSRRAMLISQQ